MLQKHHLNLLLQLRGRRRFLVVVIIVVVIVVVVVAAAAAIVVVGHRHRRRRGRVGGCDGGAFGRGDDKEPGSGDGSGGGRDDRLDDADYVTRREFETRLKMMDDKLQLLAVALRQREAQHEDLELQVRELAARLPMPGANFGGAPGRASHHQSPRHMPWQPGGGAGEPEYYDGDAALVHPDGDLDDEEGGAFDEVGGDEQPIGEAGIVSVPPGSGGMVQIDLELSLIHI